MIKDALQAIEAAQVKFDAIPLKFSKTNPKGKRNGNALNLVTHSLTKELQGLGMEADEAFRTAREMALRYQFGK